VADFITNEVSLDRHGRRDGWFIEPSGSRPALFLSDQELDALVAWRTGAGIWQSPPEPPSIADMAPGTTFTAEGAGVADTKHRFHLMERGGTRWLTCLTHSTGARPDYVDPSTIRDVTPPKGDDRG